MSRILLLLDQKENQRLLADELSSRHEVLIGEKDDALEQEFDLCLLDGRSLDRLEEALQARKEAAQPIFLPILLVTSRPDVTMVTRHLWKSVDELVITPIEKPELWARVEILLRARSLSLALHRRARDAESAANSRDEVLAIVSHDLRNPLNAVMMSAGFLVETADGVNEKERAQLQMIQRAAGQMNRLIQDLLEVAGLEGKAIAVECEPVAVEQLVGAACDALQQAAAAKSIRLVSSLAPSLPPVQADSDRVLQVFGNLIGNALKFTPEEGSIEIAATPEDGHVRFSITDDGPGIAAPDLPHVFDRFWQASKKKQGGAGLGLAISQKIVQAHGGEIWVESTVGKGSSFHFILPIASQGSATAPPD